MDSYFGRFEFNKAVKKYFLFLESEFNYKFFKEKNDNTLIYCIEYSNDKNIISISYEVFDKILNVIIFVLVRGHLPNYDDKTKTHHLSDLMKKVDENISSYIQENNNYFSKYNETLNNNEKVIFKKAKELRLYLMQDNNF